MANKKGRINLSKTNKQKAKLNNHLFFNYNNEIEDNCYLSKVNNHILEIVMSDKNCTAKFGNKPDQTMNIHSIKIVKNINNYEPEMTPDGEIILTYRPLKDSISEYGQVCIKLKEVNDPEDARINDFFKPMLVKGSDGYSNNRKSDEEKFKINLDHLIPNGSPFYYAIVAGTVLDHLSPDKSNVILFDDYSTVYCPSGILNGLDSINSEDKKSPYAINDNNLTINHSGSVNEDEEFITECTPIGADVNPEDWSKPAKNTIFSFFTNTKELKSVAMSKILKGELFDFGDYEGDDMVVYVAFHLIILFILCAIVVALANLAGPGMYYKEGVKAGVAQTLGTDK